MVEPKDEMTTKERILDVAIGLFAEKGFDAVAMREISEAAGVKKATLYYYFTSKEEILRTIIEYFLGKWGSSKIGKWSDDRGIEEQVVAMGLDGFLAMASGVFTSWIDDPRMEKIMRIVFIEMYHNEQISGAWGEFTGAGLGFFEESFAILMKHKLVKPMDPKVLTIEYMSFYMLAFVDYFIMRYNNVQGSFVEEYGDRIDEHTAFFKDAIKP